MRLFFLPVFFVPVLLAACGGSKSAGVSSAKPITPIASPAPSPSAVSTNLPMKPDNRTVNWVDSEKLMPVLEEAHRLNKPVFVDFWATWCAPCKVMEEEVFSQPDVFVFLNTHFLCVRIDYDSANGKNICGLYNVEGLPTVLFLDPKGKELGRETGMSTPTRLRAAGEAALKGH